MPIGFLVDIFFVYWVSAFDVAVYRVCVSEGGDRRAFEDIIVIRILSTHMSNHTSKQITASTEKLNHENDIMPASHNTNMDVETHQRIQLEKKRTNKLERQMITQQRKDES